MRKPLYDHYIRSQKGFFLFDNTMKGMVVTNMTIEVALLISGVSMAFAIFQGITNLKRNKAVDDKKEASEMTTVIVKLENIGKDTSEIKNDLRNIRNDVKNNSENIVRLDESLKSAWKIINHLQGADVHIEPTRKDENS